jgi:hypothetical protein
MSYPKKPIPPDSVLRILADAQEAKNARAAEMQTEQDAINAIHRAYSRLKDLGWRDGMYMPKDGTKVTVIQVGSTGQFDCAYVGEWSDGFFYLYDSGDVYPTRSVPPLFKPKTE